MVVTKDDATPSRPAPFWVRWLTVAACGVSLFGLGMVLAPSFTHQAFGLLLYANSQRVTSFGGEALRYVTLLHGVLGAVLLGWGLGLLLIARGSFSRGNREGWSTLAITVSGWFVPDTALSLWTGFWQNALLNLAIALLFGIPLAMTYRVFRNE